MARDLQQLSACPRNPSFDVSQLGIAAQIYDRAPKPIWARITSGGTDAIYGYAQVVENANGDDWETLAGGITGTTTDLPAREANGNENVPAHATTGAVVLLFPSADWNSWEFVYQPSTTTFTGAVAYTAVEAPLTATQNNYAISTTSNYLYWTGANAVTINGVVAPSPETTQVFRIRNDKTENVTWTYNSGSASANNSIYTYSQENLIQAPGEEVELKYDTENNRWVVAVVGDGLYENKKQVITNTGSTQNEVMVADKDVPNSNGQRDSDIWRQRATSYDGSPHTVDWRFFIDVTSNAGASTYVWQRQINGGGYATYMSLTDAGHLTTAGNLIVGNYIELTEISTPSPDPAANKAFLYLKDFSGESKLVYRRSDGTEVVIEDASGGGIEGNWVTVTKDYTDFSAASTTNDIEIYELADGDVLHAAIMRSTITFAGPGLMQYNISLGADSPNFTGIMFGTDFAATAPVINQSFDQGIGMYEAPGGSPTSIRAKASSSGINLNAVTAGEVVFLLLVSTP